MRNQSNASRKRFSPSIFCLEDRLAPAGITVITHGYSLAGGSQVDWMNQLGDTIASRIPGSDEVRLDYNYEAGTLNYSVNPNSTPLTPAQFQASSGHEYIINTLWHETSNNDAPGFAEAVADGLYGELRRYGFTAAQIPFHFIGHSFGTVVISETIQRLGYWDGIVVDQMTTLDPHDFAELLVPIDGTVAYPDVRVWSNITYADNYL